MFKFSRKKCIEMMEKTEGDEEGFQYDNFGEKKESIQLRTDAQNNSLSSCF